CTLTGMSARVRQCFYSMQNASLQPWSTHYALLLEFGHFTEGKRNHETKSSNNNKSNNNHTSSRDWRGVEDTLRKLVSAVHEGMQRVPLSAGAQGRGLVDASV